MLKHIIFFLFFLSWFGNAGENYKVKMGKLEEVEVNATKALVYIVRPSFLGKAIRFWTFSGKEVLTVTHGKQGSYVYLEPGDHILWSRAENVSVLPLKLRAGRTYWLLQRVFFGVAKARTELRQISESEGRRMMKKCKRVVLTDSGRARGKEIAETRWEQIKRIADFM